MNDKIKYITIRIIAYFIPISILTILITLLSMFFIGIYRIGYNLIFKNCIDPKITCFDFYGYNISLSSFIKFINPNLNGFEMAMVYFAGIYILFSHLPNIGKAILKLIKHTCNGIIILLKIFFKILLRIFKIKIMFKTSSIEKLLSIYFGFLKRYIKIGDFTKILKTHMFLIKGLFLFKKLPTEGKEYHLIQVPFEFKNMINELNIKLNRFVLEGTYARGPFVFKDNFISLYINEGIQGFEKTKANILSKKSEFTKILPGFNSSNGGSPFDIDITENKKDIKLRFYNLNIWKIINLDLKKLEIIKGHFLAGFYPELTDDGVVYKNYYIPFSNIIHSFIVGGSTNGKDVFTNNIIISILNEIRQGKGKEIYALDSKTCDWEYLENLKGYGIYRSKDISKFIGILEGLQKEMFRRQDKFGIHSKLSNYIEANPEEKNEMKEIYIFINEIFALFSEMDQKETSKMASLLVSILSKGAGAGLHIILLGQSIRKNTDPEFAKILVNISSRFSVKINNRDEAEIAGRGLSSENLGKLNNLTKYNCVHIEDNEIRKEFRAYYFTQMDILHWIKDNFKQDIINFDNPKIENYLIHSKKTGKISLKSAQNDPFNLSRSEWNELIKYLTYNDLIIRNSDNSLSFKNQNS